MNIAVNGKNENILNEIIMRETKRKIMYDEPRFNVNPGSDYIICTCNKYRG